MNKFICVDCGREIKIDVPRCLSCIWKKKKQGICCWCGEAPVKSAQSKYCADCQAEAIDKAWRRAIKNKKGEFGGRRHRSADMRENTRETKSGRD